MSRTTYSPATATRMTTDAGFVVSSEFVLEPQTTPFVQPTQCKPSIYCAAGSMTPSGWCVEVDTMWESDFDIVSSECYPPEYTNIYLYKGEGADLTTAAFPGTACMSGWTTACSGAIVGEDSSTYSQTFCCPPGDYTCDMQWTRRECLSMLSTSTDLWVDNTTATYGFQTTTFAGFDDGEEPIWVWRRAFPLTNVPQVEASATGTADTTATDVGPAANSVGAADDGDGTSLSTGGLAGVVIGGVAALALLIGLGFWIHRRRRPEAVARRYEATAGSSPTPPQYQPQYFNAVQQGQQQPPPPPSQHSLAPPPAAFGGSYYYDKAAELASYNTEIAELPANYGPGSTPSEMDAQSVRSPDQSYASPQQTVSPEGTLQPPQQRPQ